MKKDIPFTIYSMLCTSFIVKRAAGATSITSWLKIMFCGPTF